MTSPNNVYWERNERTTSATYPSNAPDTPAHAVVSSDAFPRPRKPGKRAAAKLTPPAEVPDADFPFVLTTGRQLEHWHTGAMTRRATTLDLLEPSAVASLSRGEIIKLGIAPGDLIRVTTRRGSIELAVRQDEA